MSEQNEASRRFVDGDNTYQLNPDAPTLRKIRDDLNVNLTTVAGYTKLRLDPLLVADVMEYLCCSQRESFGRSQEDFSRTVLKSKGAALEAITAVMEDFLPDDLIRDLVEKKQMNNSDLQQEAMLDVVMEKINAGDPEMIAQAIRAATS